VTKSWWFIRATGQLKIENLQFAIPNPVKRRWERLEPGQKIFAVGIPHGLARFGIRVCPGVIILLMAPYSGAALNVK
jgi:hypothetical protein